MERGRAGEAIEVVCTVIEPQTGKPAETRTAANIAKPVETGRHKQTVEAPGEPKSYLDHLANAIHEPIFVKNRQHRLILVSDATCLLTGRKSSELLGETDYALFPKDQARVFWEKEESVFETGEEDIDEEEIVDGQGFVHTVVTKRSLYKDQKGNEFIVGIMSDIRECGTTEGSFNAPRQQFQNIIEFLPDAALVIDRESKVVAWNRAMEDMTGVPKDAMLGMGDYAYAVPIYGEPKPILIDLVVRDAMDRQGGAGPCGQRCDALYGEAYIPIVYGGRGAHLLGTASPLFDGNGNLIGAVEALRDITERKRLEIALIEREKDLEEKARQLEEINTTLKVLLHQREEDKKDMEESILANMKRRVLPFLEKLRMSRLDEKQEQYLEILESGVTEIVSPFLKNISIRFKHLTPTETLIAGLIREGKASREIAEILGAALKTILVHRHNLRMKLGLRNQKMNLRSYLMSIL